jgi:hypothetical protein
VDCQLGSREPFRGLLFFLEPRGLLLFDCSRCLSLFPFNHLKRPADLEKKYYEKKRKLFIPCGPSMIDRPEVSGQSVIDRPHSMFLFACFFRCKMGFVVKNNQVL